MIQLTFDQEHRYKDSDEGITIEVELFYQEQTFVALAKVDPGSSVCLFSNEIGQRLGLSIEQGIPKRLGSLTGSLDAFGHEVTLQTGDIAFQSIVYFAKFMPRLG